MVDGMVDGVEKRGGEGRSSSPLWGGFLHGVWFNGVK